MLREFVIDLKAIIAFGTFHIYDVTIFFSTHYKVCGSALCVELAAFHGCQASSRDSICQVVTVGVS